MCWPSKQSMVCIQEAFNCSVAVIIGEYVVMLILYVKIILSPYIFFFFLKYCCIINGITLFLYKNYIVSQTLKYHHNIKGFL
jgi:hypothetical protein